MVSINRPEVNMRTGPGTQHSAIWALSKGYPLQVLQRQNKWLKVRDFENDIGWVYRPLVGQQKHHIVKASTANLRSAPTTQSRIVGKAERGEVLRTLDKRSGWIKVQRHSGSKGWIAQRLLWGW
jgi:SH3-like domain-containing protein